MPSPPSLYSYRVKDCRGVTSGHVYAANEQEAKEKVLKTGIDKSSAIILEVKKVR
jgi:hypothetical protein